MNQQEARLFLAAMAALESENSSKGLIEDAEPMAATCTVERSDK